MPTTASVLFVLGASAGLAQLARILTNHTSGIHTARWANPIIALGKGAWIKGFGSLVAIQFQVPEWIIVMLADAFSVRPQAAFALAFVMSFDLLSGIYASWWRKTDELDRVAKPADFLSSRRLRDSIVKVGEYVSILLLFTVGSNVWEAEFGWAKRWAFMMVFFTEAWSTKENFQHVPVRHLMARLKKIAERKNPTMKTKPVDQMEDEETVEGTHLDEKPNARDN